MEVSVPTVTKEADKIHVQYVSIVNLHSNVAAVKMTYLFK